MKSTFFKSHPSLPQSFPLKRKNSCEKSLVACEAKSDRRCHGGDVVRLKVRHRRQPRGDANDRGGARGGHSSCHPVNQLSKPKIAPWVRLSSGACATREVTRRVLPAGARNRPEGKDSVYLGGGEGRGRSEEVTRRTSSPSRTPCFWA